MELINWFVTYPEQELIVKIAQRAKEQLGRDDKIETMMNITATHANGTPLDLQKLLEFDLFNFAHDIAGIENHIDATTGQLTKGFLPRCAKH